MRWPGVALLVVSSAVLACRHAAVPIEVASKAGLVESLPCPLEGLSGVVTHAAGAPVNWTVVSARFGSGGGNTIEEYSDTDFDARFRFGPDGRFRIRIGQERSTWLEVESPGFQRVSLEVREYPACVATRWPRLRATDSNRC